MIEKALPTSSGHSRKTVYFKSISFSAIYIETSSLLPPKMMVYIAKSLLVLGHFNMGIFKCIFQLFFVYPFALSTNIFLFISFPQDFRDDPFFVLFVRRKTLPTGVTSVREISTFLALVILNIRHCQHKIFKGHLGCNVLLFTLLDHNVRD